MENFTLCAMQSIDLQCNSTDQFPYDMIVDIKWVARSFQFKFFRIYLFIHQNFPQLTGPLVFHTLNSNNNNQIMKGDFIQNIFKKRSEIARDQNQLKLKLLIQIQGIYMFKVDNGNTKTMCKICSKLTLKTTEQRQ